MYANIVQITTNDCEQLRQILSVIANSQTDSSAASTLMQIHELELAKQGLSILEGKHPNDNK